ncbi:sulfatase-like hydrolase/transferase [Haloarcula marismortui]|uniref:sulfatase-like hydrolase/transferase n=1 Tax=Haloarcula marismortui TaxID=2238 RepID=UPI003C730725
MRRDQIIDRVKNVVQDASEPFFLFTNFVETHDPYRPPEDFIREYLPETVTTGEANAVADSHLVDLSLDLDSLSKREREIMIALYDAEIRYIDSKIREMAEFLKQRNEFENTVFIVCADHGDLFGEWGIWGHQGTIHRDLCRVPLVISTPWNEGQRHTQPVELRKLAEYLPRICTDKKEPMATQDAAVVEYHGWDCQISKDQWEKFNSDEKSRWGVYSAGYFTDEWQLLVSANGNHWLYNLAEELPVSKDGGVEKSEIVDELQEDLFNRVGATKENHNEYRERANTDAALAETSDEVRQHLKDLGYA